MSEEIIRIPGLPGRGRALVLGTSPAADVQVPQVGTVAPLHALVRRTLAGRCYLESPHGYPTRIERDGRSFQVYQRGETTHPDGSTLQPGDVIRLGGHVRLLWTGEPA